MLIIAPDLMMEIRRHLEAAYSNEGCGFILGTFADDFVERRAVKILPLPNRGANCEQYHRFSLAPEDFFNAEKIARAAKLEVIGIFHSHPDNPAVPSDFDREHALPVYSYLIVAVYQRQAVDIKSWLLTADRKRFNEESIAGG